MKVFKQLCLEAPLYSASTGTAWFPPKDGKKILAFSPVDGTNFFSITQASRAETKHIIKTARKAFEKWRNVPAPRRGDIVRQIGNRVRLHKDALGQLISYETGKPLQEGLGEVQEMIDVCDYAVGLSRMLYGMTTVSERPMHRLYEQYQPLGIIGIITAFNFPLAVWSWNAMLATVCGDVCIWKPSSKAPITAIAMQKIIGEVLQENDLFEGIFSLIIGDRQEVGEKLLNNPHIPLISFTGSVTAGRHAAQVVARRLGKTLLELGGNNAIILTEHADLDLAIPAAVFGAVGTTGQRCTTTRRLYIHTSIYDQVVQRLIRAYKSLRIGNPLKDKNHVGPLIDHDSVHTFLAAITTIKSQGGRILHGGLALQGKAYKSACYVQPTLAAVKAETPIIQEETFAPILYLIRYAGSVEQAISLQNNVKQGLSSAIFTTNLREAELFLSAAGSDCGIANVNIGTSGAEIGGAFGGEKETGGGRESGSDAWKIYMRRQTVTCNYGRELPLAQGINFHIA